MTVLVLGGTGTVGSQIVGELRGKGVATRVASRSKEKAEAVANGATGVIVDLERPETLGPAFEGVNAAFLLTPLAQNETEQGLAAVEAARTAGVKRIVYLSVADAEGGRHIPHFGGKLPIEQAVRESGAEWSILRPNNFFQNDYWLRDAIVDHGVYPQPIGNVGLDRIDVRDIADAAVNCLIGSGHNGMIYTLGGPDRLTGEGVAEIYSRALGRTVRYAGDDLDAWAANARNMLPDWLIRDFRTMYRHFQEKGFKSTPEQVRNQVEAIGHPPRRFETFAAEAVSAWTRPS